MQYKNNYIFNKSNILLRNYFNCILVLIITLSKRMSLHNSDFTDLLNEKRDYWHKSLMAKIHWEKVVGSGTRIVRSGITKNNKTFKQNVPEQVSSLTVPVQAGFEQQAACPLLLFFQIPSGENRLYFPYQIHVATARNQCIALLNKSSSLTRCIKSLLWKKIYRHLQVL